MRPYLLLLLAVLLPAADGGFPTVVLKNDVVEIEVSTLQGSLKSVRQLGVAPIGVYSWHEDLLHRRGVELPDPTKPLAVLDEFNPKGGKHNWIACAGLPFNAPWTVTQTDAQHATLSAQDAATGLHWEFAYELPNGHPTIINTLRVTNRGGKDIDLAPTLYPINGIHQDDPAADAAYVTVGRHYGGKTGSIENLGMPAPGVSEAVSSENLDYVVFKSRFFAALFAPISAQLSGTTPVATPVQIPVAASVESGGPPAAVQTQSTVPAPITGGNFTTTISAHGYALPIEKGATKQAYIQATYTAGGGPIRLVPQQTLTIAWKLTATALDKTSALRLEDIERKAEYTEGYYRFFRVLAKACTWLLELTASVVINYGVAILVLTFLIKLALHKTTFKQQESMMKMQKLQPELKLLQETYKADKQKLAQKQMELWKKHGVNPLGGCLPIFLQIPIFTALYLAFSHSADMRGHGFLWIKDLTLPDAVWGWQLPFSMPLVGDVFTINPLPIIYIGVTIWMSLSQKIPTGGDPQQEQTMKMMRWMPVMFGVIFYAMPSGLVLYFTANAVLSTIEIKMVKKKLGMA